MRGTTHHTAPTLNDEQLVALVIAFRDGDRGAFRALYDMFSTAVYRFCRHMIGDEAMAKDAFQETFIRMFEHRQELRGTNVRSWLFTISRRVCLTHLRSRRAAHISFDETFHAQGEHQQSDVLLKEQIERALDQLPVALRDALVLREYEGHSYLEIAAIVGIDLSLAKVRVYRARLMMRKLLATVAQQIR